MSKDTIKTLDTRQQCREKLPIFFGSRDNYTHGVKEVVANAIDEISNNFENGDIYVTLHSDNKTISVKDTGRGIPIDTETDGVPNYKLLFETLFAGTNFENNQNDKVAVGTNGCGTCVLNHTSKLFKVTAARNGKITELLYHNGGEFQHIKTIGETNEHWSEFEFLLDDEVYASTTYIPDEIDAICKYNAAVNNKVNIYFIYNGVTKGYHYDSIYQYFEENSNNNTCKIYEGYSKMYDLKDEKNKIQASVCTSSENFQQSFLNSNYLQNGGTINRGLIYGARDYVNAYLKKKKMLDKKNGEVSHTDIEESLSFVVSIESTNVEYENQTKLSTNKALYRDIAKDYINGLLEVFEIEQPKEFEKFINHILEVQKFNGRAQASKKALKKKLSEKVDNLTNRIEGLVDCKHHGENCEIFIAEGKSALGSIVAARNPQNQAAIAIRGKILNCLKVDYETVFKNDTVTDIIKALGCGIETDKKNKDLGCFDKKALRYNNIIIATDADPDGYQIACLLLTMFYRLTPTLIKEGHIYIALTPLFEIRDVKTGEYHYAFTDEEKDQIISKLSKYQVNRNKGLGEVDADVMYRTGVNPETRNIMKVTYDDAEEMIKMFEHWMGNSTVERKKYIENDLNKYVDLSE